MFRIANDETIGFGEKWRQKYNLHAMPSHVIFGDRAFQAGVDLNNGDFFRQVRETRIIPKTSLPAYGQSSAFYRSIARKADKLFSSHVGSGRSGRWQTVQAFANQPTSEFAMFDFDLQAGSADEGMLSCCKAARSHGDDVRTDIPAAAGNA